MSHKPKATALKQECSECHKLTPDYYICEFCNKIICVDCLDNKCLCNPYNMKI